MKIASSAISMQGVSSQTSYLRISTTQQRAVLKVNGNGDILSLNEKTDNKGSSINEHLKKIRQMLKEQYEKAEEANKVVEAQSLYEPTSKEEMEINMIKSLLKHLTGKDIEFKSHKDFKLGDKSQHTAQPKLQHPLMRVQNQGSPFRLVEWNSTRSEMEVYEAESFSFNASGVINTTDGKQINFSLELNMSREFYSKVSQSTEQLKFVDPLVINFNGNSAELTQDKFRFDLDCDGEEDQISKLGSGSGFLAYDKDGNGTIDDGSELFGATSGDGFKDLAAYDDDGNGWIDENDDIFNKLRIWTFDEEGNSVLSGLGEKGIGAIYLGNVDTLFNVRDNDEVQGMLRKTGIYLNENGTAGTIQHVDFRL